jgi:hypothetical protein
MTMARPALSSARPADAAEIGIECESGGAGLVNTDAISPIAVGEACLSSGRIRLLDRTSPNWGPQSPSAVRGFALTLGAWAT